MIRVSRLRALKAIDRPDVSLDPERLELAWAGERIRLTPTEFVILHLLVERPGVIRTRDELLDAVGDEGDRDERTVDTMVRRLRRTLGQVPRPNRAGPLPARPIETIYGVGYCWTGSE